MRAYTMLLCGTLLTAPLLAQAQDTEKQSQKSVLQQVVPKPTGQNGYEEWIAAGEIAKNNKLLEQAIQEGASLSAKRQVVNDPQIQRALTLFRAGLAKQTFSPRKELDDETVLPEFALFRNLGRLLTIEQYVRLADGNVPGAIDSIRDGLLLGYRIQTDTLISGLVGIAIDAILIQRIIRHLDQFSLRDCTRMVTLMEEWLKAPSPMIAVMQSERDGALRILQKYRDNSQGLLTLVQGGEGDQADHTPSPLEKYLENDPQNLNAVVDGAITRLKRHYETLLTELRKPAWERKMPLSEADKSLSSALVNTLLVASHMVTDRYESERATMRLLAVHAAIRRYRWEHDRPPDTLKELRLDPIFTLDPFTGETLNYQRKGDTYELSSVGPFARGEDGVTDPKRREPIFLPRRSTASQ